MVLPFYTYRKILIIIAGLPLILCISCKKFVSVDPPANQAISSSVFSNEKTATAATVGLYTQMMSGTLSLNNGGLSVYPSLSGDELMTTAPNVNGDPFLTNSISPTSSVVANSLWNHAYANIYHANSIIKGLNESQTLHDSTKRLLTGEAKLIRAWHYFHLLNLFDDVPLITTTDYYANSKAPRTPVTQVYQQIISDAQEAQTVLPSYYITTATYPTARVRANKWAATALLAKVYLYLKNWNDAEIQATALINSGVFSLTANLNNVFLATSNEAIWQLMPTSASYNTSEGNSFIPANATTRPTYALTSFLLNSFEPGDQRKVNWIKSTTISGQTFHYPYKYKIRTGTAPYGEYNMVFRLAEIYLTRAEARNELGNLSSAISDLNIIRTRAGLSNTQANDLASLRVAIQSERRIELFTEWGNRWYDLKRTGKADAELSTIKGLNWQSTDMLYPLPFNELQRNPNLVQNPGY